MRTRGWKAAFGCTAQRGEQPTRNKQTNTRVINKQTLKRKPSTLKRTRQSRGQIDREDTVWPEALGAHVVVQVHRRLPLAALAARHHQLPVERAAATQDLAQLERITAPVVRAPGHAALPQFRASH